MIYISNHRFCDTFKLILGDRQADFMLQTGALVTADEAISVGLVDQAVPHDEVKPQAVKMLHTFLSVPDMARFVRCSERSFPVLF